MVYLRPAVLAVQLSHVHDAGDGRRAAGPEWQVCHRHVGAELLAKARMAIVDGESEERKEVIGELVAAG